MKWHLSLFLISLIGIYAHIAHWLENQPRALGKNEYPCIQGYNKLKSQWGQFFGDKSPIYVSSQN